MLNEIQGRLQIRGPRYWRNKQGAEIDFVLPRRGAEPLAIECKWSASAFEAGSLRAFRHLHPGGDNYVVANDVSTAYARTYDGLDVSFVSLGELIERLGAESLSA